MEGLMDIKDPAMRDRLVALKLQRDRIATEIAELQKHIGAAEPIITPEKVERMAELLRDRLYGNQPELRQAYARLLMDEVSVTREEIRISGSKTVLAWAVSSGEDIPAPAVLSFVQEWRARRDSNS
jgi:site-specific DNA recombinase